MKHLLLIFLYLHSSECRVTSAEVELEQEAREAKELPLLNLPCTFRSLKSDDPYPSVVLKWNNKVPRFTWDSEGNVVSEEDYKHQAVSVSYPSSSGLSGGESKPQDPFANADQVPDEYTWSDITEWFSSKCVKPY